MKKYATFALPLAVLCSVLTIGANIVMGFVITIQMFIPTAQLPLIYFDFLHLPFFLMFLPFVSVLALLPLALEYALDKDFALPQFHLVEHDVPKSNEAVVLDQQSLKAA